MVAEQDEVLKKLDEIIGRLADARSLGGLTISQIMRPVDARRQTLKIKVAARELQRLHLSMLLGKGRQP